MRTSLPLALLLAITPAAAGSAEIDVTFTGTITEVSPQIASGFTEGAPVSGSFRIDTESPDLEPGPDEGSYDAISIVSFDFGGYTGSAPLGFLFLRDGAGAFVDNFHANAEPAGAAVAGFPPGDFVFNLGDSTHAAITSDDIPLALDLADFDTADVSLSFDDLGTSYPVYASITTLSYEVVPVPEPCAPLLAAAGVLTLLAVGRRSSPKG